MKIAISADPEIPVPPILYGGIERVIALLISELIKNGHEVTLFAHHDSKVNCKLIPYPGKDQSLKSLVLNCLLITKTILKSDFDVVHSFARIAYLTFVLPLKIPKLISYQREPTIKQIKNALFIAKKSTLHFSGCSNYISNKIKPFAEATTIYNGVPSSFYQVKTAIEYDTPLVFLGRIEPVKGTELAITIAQNTGKKLLIAGNIPPENRIYFDEKIKPRLNDNISYIGAVNDLQKKHLLQNALALLMPVLWNEPFGIVMAEAMACGTPVIGFKRGAVAEVIEQGKSGFYGETLEDLVKAVDKVYFLDRKLVRATMENRFSETVIADGYLKLYRKLVNKEAFDRK